MIEQVLAAPINHVLRGESWALRRLAPFAGRTASFLVAPFLLAFTVRDSGEVAPAARGAVADVHLAASPAAAARILAGDTAAYDQVRVEGDSEFAEAIRHVLRHARWDVEEDLARFLGDAAAYRAASIGRSLLRVPIHTVDRLTHNLADYWVEERPLIARRADVAQWLEEVDRLRDDVERLAQRVQRL